MPDTKMKLFLWAILIIPVWSSSTPLESKLGCFQNFDQNNCVYNVTCIEDTNIFINFDEQQGCSKFSYTYQSYLPVNVIFKRKSFNDDTLSIIWRNTPVYAIFELNISKNKFKKEPVLDNMPNLKILNMSNNDLTTVKLSNEFEYSKLVEIDLSYNKIMHLYVDNTENVYYALQILDLSHNALDKLSEEFFRRFTKLDHLNLSYNHLTDLYGSLFEGLNNLRILNLDHNDLIDVNSSFLMLNDLQELSLKENRIEEVLIRDFQNLINIKKLDLSSNDISHIEEGVFNNMTSLNKLDLSDNLIEDITMKCFHGNLRLNSINLSENKLSSLPDKLFVWKNISFFSIKNNNLDGELVKGKFDGLNNVISLDIANQKLTSIGDTAFFGLDKLEKLLLNNNSIRTLHKRSFRLLRNLKYLDLSNNFITSIDFEKDHLENLEILILNYNYIINVVYDDLYNLKNLKFLYMSYNRNLNVAAKTLKELHKLEKITLTLLYPVLYSNLFDDSIPLVDIDVSFSEIRFVRNDTFKGMAGLKYINMSNCLIEDVQFNSFSYTGNVITIDLSHNQLTNFAVNSTDLNKLETLLLNNNKLKIISFTAFKNFPSLLDLNLSYNDLKEIHEDSSKDQISLLYLDVSFNKLLSSNIIFLGNLKNLIRLNISGVTNSISFAELKKLRLNNLQISHAGIKNVSSLNIHALKRLENLVMNSNEISVIEKDTFLKSKRLQHLDLSFNHIKYIQPGSFKHNIHLKTLNISYNFLAAFEYGTFRGLIRLKSLDLSHNSLGVQATEILTEAENLESLIIDSNRLDNIDYIGLSKTSLAKLSIGDNPISCKRISTYMTYLTIEITAQNMNEYKENYKGLTCNKQL
ncbi:toll-like receptor 3 [Battus philenor]|uniref:toll-like receptor 3 n=1 Tax=Battus philenor TaxID=42288 RepID=UPI0035CF3D69